MQLTCPHCQALLEYSVKQPSFCAYCGQALTSSRPTIDVATAESPRPHSSPTIDFDPEAATVPPPSYVSEPAGEEPTHVRNYRLLRPLGSGGMGTVYEAEETTTARRVALKLVSASYAASRDAMERFRREGRLTSSIAHPRCVFVLAADEEAGRPYIVMELMTGDTLHDLVKAKGPLPIEEAVSKILDVIDGLDAAHRLGVIHRDVKPSNCFLEADGRVKIGDFGLSKSLVSDTHLTKTGSFMGTALFASPEQIRADPIDQRSDLYSVCATLYCLLTGQAPFQTGDAAATMARIVSDPAPSMRSIRPEIPAALDRIVLRGLERARDRRWQDLTELRRALVPFLPATLTAGPLGPRLLAHLTDWLLVTCAAILPVFCYVFWEVFKHDEPPEMPQLSFMLASETAWFLYFVLLEGLTGRSLGKRLFRLRLSNADGGESPTFLRTLYRTAIWFAVIPLPWGIIEVLHHLNWLAPDRTIPSYFFLFQPVARVLTILLLCAPMRQQNGWRGLHDWLSKTRVLRASVVASGAPLTARTRTGTLDYLGRRSLAFVLDMVFLCPAWFLIYRLLHLVFSPANSFWEALVVEQVAPGIVFGVSFGIMEGMLGWTLAKKLLRLRVEHADSAHQPGLLRGALRSLVFFIVTTATASLTLLAERELGEEWGLLALGISPFADLALLFLPVPRQSGWRGLHEFLSGTRVVALPFFPARSSLQSREGNSLLTALVKPEGMPKRVGPFVVRGAACWNEEDRVLVGEDESLQRPVCVQLRSLTKGPVESTRRDVSRPTRLRWLGTGVQGDDRWDAYVCPAGSPLAEVVSPESPLIWAEAIPFVIQLTEELAAACQDRTLPETLSASQVWVTPEGRLLLLGTALTGVGGPTLTVVGTTDEQRALALIREICILCLEGQERPPERAHERLRAPLSARVAALLGRLIASDARPLGLNEWAAELTALAVGPVAVSREHRALQLALLALLNFPGYIYLVLVAVRFSMFASLDLSAVGYLFAFPLLCVLVSALVPGGISLYVLGFRLVEADGQPARRWRCALRTALVWLPSLTLFLGAALLSLFDPAALESADFGPGIGSILGCLGAGIIAPVAFLLLPLVDPMRSILDRLAGTWVVLR